MRRSFEQWNLTVRFDWLTRDAQPTHGQVISCRTSAQSRVLFRSHFASTFIDRHVLNKAAFTLDSDIMAHMIADNVGP